MALILSLFSLLASQGPALTDSDSHQLEAPPVWTHLGPGGGGQVNHVAYDPADPEHLLIGSDVTGLFRSVDGGESWSTSTQGLSGYYARSAVVHPVDSALLFLATEAGISRSLDGGDTWETALELILRDSTTKYACAFGTVLVDPLDPSVVWAGVGGFRLSDAAGPGGDVQGQYAHVWRSAALGAPGSWKPIHGPCDTGGVHSILPRPIELDPHHDGADRLLVSSTVGVYELWVDILGDWQWTPRDGGLPHVDARDLEALYGPGGDVDRLFLVLDSHWDQSDTASALSIYDHASGHGGGVWFSDDLGLSWHPTSFQSGSDGLHLEDGYVSGTTPYPKNMRHLAVDQAKGVVYLALTWRSMKNEGVWKTDAKGPAWSWERISESRTYGSWPLNMQLDHFTTLGGIDGLAVEPTSGDVVLTTKQAAYRCPGGDCDPLDPAAPWWEPLHTVITPGTPDTYTTTGMDVTQAFQVIVAPRTPDTWYLSIGDFGLFRSDDRGERWRPITTTTADPYTFYGARNCHGIFFLPGSPTQEVLGIFGAWKYPPVFELWSSAGLPEADSSWTRHALGTPSDYVRAVLPLDAAHVLVAADSGVWLGVESGGAWTFQSDEAGLPPGTSRRAVALSASPGPLLARRQLLSLRKFGALAGGLYWRDGLAGPWQPAAYASGPPQGDQRVQCFAWSATDPAKVYAGAGSIGLGSAATAGVLMSRDGGISWAMVAEDIAHTPLDCVDVVGLATWTGPGGSERLACAIGLPGGPGSEPCKELTPGGVFRSKDGARTWSRLDEGLDAGHSTFLRYDSGSGGHLFYGTLGNGAYALDSF